MLQSKLISLLRNFNKEEFKRFETFLLSPYFNQSEKLVRFFRLIEPHYPEFTSKKLEKEKLYIALHGKSEYNDMTMRNLISELFKLGKVFVAQEAYGKDQLQASVYRHLWLAERDIPKLVDAEIETRRAMMEGYVLRDDDYYHHKWLFDLHKFKVSSERLRGSEHKLLKHFDFWAPSHALNRNYLVNCFWLYLYLLTIELIYNFPMDESLMSQVELLAPRYLNQGDTVIDIFYNIYKMIRTDEEKYYHELKARFMQHDPAVPFLLRREACVALENYCIEKIRIGEDRFISEVMQLYRAEAEYELYLENGKMDTVYYYNVAMRGAECGELDWAEKFIDDHKEFLPEDQRESSYDYAKAFILFGRGRYMEALRLGLTCNISFFMGKLSLKMLVIRTHYELDMTNEIQVELDSLRHHLRDEKLSEVRRQFLQNFYIIMRQLCDLKGNYSREKHHLLKEYLKNNRPIPNKRWVMEKIAELEG